MATITSSIGTNSRDYSSIQAWIDSIPGDGSGSANTYVGECYNDSEFTAVASFASKPTAGIILKCAAGHSWRDNANVQTNRFAYDVANGVGLRLTGSYLNAISIASVNNVTIDGLQIKCTAGSTGGISVTGTSSGCKIKNCIIQSQPSAALFVVNLNSTAASSIFNCLVIANTSVAGGGIRLSSASSAINCTVVRPSNITAAGKAFSVSYGTSIARNCALFGFTTSAFVDIGGAYNSSSYNCTDLATAPGSTGNRVSKTYANQFVQSSIASAVEDYRVVGTGSDLYDFGITDTTNIATADDAAGTSRPQGTAWDIGAWEYKVDIIPPPPAQTRVTVFHTRVRNPITNFSARKYSPRIY